MEIVSDLQAMQGLFDSSASPVLVPTMGNLHAGHISLVKLAREHANGRPVIVSIFVNPLQFAPDEDFDTYPRTFKQDCAQLTDAGCDLVFVPTVSDLYPKPQNFRVMPDPALDSVLEGATRPGFFEGVCTVVMKLLCVTRPAVAVFGSKDFQQLMVIRAMVKQFSMPIEIVSGPTIRESDGLAMSSRNGYLEPELRKEAPALFRALQAVADSWHESEAKGIARVNIERDNLTARGWAVDYFGAYDSETLSPIGCDIAGTRNVVLLAAAQLDDVRLIDNLELPSATG